MKIIKTVSLAFAMLVMLSFANARSNQQSNQQSKKTNEMGMKTQYIEVVRFNLKAGVTPDQLFKAEKDIRQGVIKSQPGYQGRELYQDADGTWLIIIRWDNKASADVWTSIFMTIKEGQSFGGLLDFSSARQEHYTLVNP
ncbi:MAG: hypothetical protein IPH88_14200 [Bacteroidales bacterium]|nr:hypothetical protein [Bacteroidales bacterium]